MAVNIANPTKAEEIENSADLKTWFMACPGQSINHFDICIHNDTLKRLYRTTDSSSSFIFQNPSDAGNDLKFWGENHSVKEVLGWRGQFPLNNLPILNTEKKILKDLLPKDSIGNNDKMILIAVEK